MLKILIVTITFFLVVSTCTASDSTLVSDDLFFKTEFKELTLNQNLNLRLSSAGNNALFIAGGVGSILLGVTAFSAGYILAWTKNEEAIFVGGSIVGAGFVTLGIYSFSKVKINKLRIKSKKERQQNDIEKWEQYYAQ